MLRLWADMPGTTEKDVEVILKDNVLTIAGVVDASIYDQLAPLYAEYNIGEFLSAVHAERGDRRLSHQGPHAQWRARSRAAQARAGKAAQNRGAERVTIAFGCCMRGRFANGPFSYQPRPGDFWPLRMRTGGECICQKVSALPLWSCGRPSAARKTRDGPRAESLCSETQRGGDSTGVSAEVHRIPAHERN